MSGTVTQPKVQERNDGSVMDMSIVLVCWNNKTYLDPCLKSLYESGLKSTFDVVVVDNGSTDGSQQMLEEKYPDVKLIQNLGNVGLGKASNQGIEATNGLYVLLLNNDTIVNGAALDGLAEFLANHPEAGAVGGILLNPDGSFQSGYGKFSTLTEELLIATGLGDLFKDGYPLHGRSDQIESVGWMSSACLLLNRGALDQVGLLDEEYFIYGDEVDLQYRLIKAGWKVYFLPTSTIVHYGGRSMDRWKRRKMVYRGKLLFYKKNYSFLQTMVLRGMLVLISTGKLLIWMLAYLFPRWRDRSIKELKSNLDVLVLCFKLK
jgi:GT2 family glycosyltransferase